MTGNDREPVVKKRHGRTGPCAENAGDAFVPITPANSSVARNVHQEETPAQGTKLAPRRLLAEETGYIHEKSSGTVC